MTTPYTSAIFQPPQGLIAKFPNVIPQQLSEAPSPKHHLFLIGCLAHYHWKWIISLRFGHFRCPVLRVFQLKLKSANIFASVSQLSDIHAVGKIDNEVAVTSRDSSAKSGKGMDSVAEFLEMRQKATVNYLKYMAMLVFTFYLS